MNMIMILSSLASLGYSFAFYIVLAVTIVIVIAFVATVVINFASSLLDKKRVYKIGKNIIIKSNSKNDTKKIFYLSGQSNKYNYICQNFNVGDTYTSEGQKVQIYDVIKRDKRVGSFPQYLIHRCYEFRARGVINQKPIPQTSINNNYINSNHNEVKGSNYGTITSKYEFLIQNDIDTILNYEFIDSMDKELLIEILEIYKVRGTVTKPTAQRFLDTIMKYAPLATLLKTSIETMKAIADLI